jgi:hypothetical protein
MQHKHEDMPANGPVKPGTDFTISLSQVSGKVMIHGCIQMSINIVFFPKNTTSKSNCG